MYNFSAEFVPLTSLSRGDIIFQHWIFFLSSSGRIAPLLRGGEMNEVVNSGVMNIASLVVSVVVLLIGLILWFLSIVPVHGLTNRLNCLRRCWISKNVKMHCYVVCAKQTNLRKQIKRPLRVKNRLKTKILFVWSPNDNPSSILSNPVVEGLLNSC